MTKNAGGRFCDDSQLRPQDDNDARSFYMVVPLTDDSDPGCVIFRHAVHSVALLLNMAPAHLSLLRRKHFTPQEERELSIRFDKTFFYPPSYIYV